MVVKLEDVVTVERGIRVVRKDLCESNKYPVYQNSLVPLGCYDESNRNANTPFVIGAGAAGQIGFCDTDYWAADDCYTFSANEQVSSRYLYFVLLKNQYALMSQVRKSSIPRLPRQALEKLEFPLPTLKEQQRIVDILDKFDVICDDISQGLPAEIEARQKQYEYYRDKLLTFKEK